MGTGGAVVSDQSIGVDPLQRITGLTDSTGTTSSTLYNDGTLNTLTEPGHNPVTINQVNPVTNDPVEITRPDGGTVQTTANDVVVEQTITSYDPDGNVILTVDRQRFNTDPDTTTGDLAGPGGGNNASRDYYSASWYDLGGRPVDAVNLGTNASVGYIVPQPRTQPRDGDGHNDNARRHEQDRGQRQLCRLPNRGCCGNRRGPKSDCDRIQQLDKNVDVLAGVLLSD